MELLPILSTIILVGTIATLILAVAAYVLYKVRERQGRGAPAPPPSTPPQPLLLTAPASAGDVQAEQLQELLRLAAAGLQQQQAPALPPLEPVAPTPPPGHETWSAPPPSATPPLAPEPVLEEEAWEDATFEDVTPLRASDLADFFGDEAPLEGNPADTMPPVSRPPVPPSVSKPPVSVSPIPRPAPKPSVASDGAVPTGGRTLTEPSGDGAASETDYQELLRLADELDQMFDGPESAPRQGQVPESGSPDTAAWG